VIALLREKFVPVAVDQHVHRRMKDEEGQFFARVLKQAGRGLGGHSQGVYLFTADGELLGFRNTSDAGTVKRLLGSALKKFGTTKPASKVEPPRAKADLPEPPAGGLVIDVTAKVLLDPDKAADARARRYLSSLGRDHLWLRRDEAEAVARGELPESVTRRIARYHLIDNTRGEPPMWRADEIKKLELTLKDGKLEGEVHLETRSGDRGYRARLLGYVEVKEGKVVRFDLLARGEFWGHGRYTRFAAPEGRFPFAVAFRLAELTCTADKVIPGGARGNLRNYLGK
jgi:hypothetical protein